MRRGGADDARVVCVAVLYARLLYTCRRVTQPLCRTGALCPEKCISAGKRGAKYARDASAESRREKAKQAGVAKQYVSVARSTEQKMSTVEL